MQSGDDFDFLEGSSAEVGEGGAEMGEECRAEVRTSLLQFGKRDRVCGHAYELLLVEAGDFLSFEKSTPWTVLL